MRNKTLKQYSIDEFSVEQFLLKFLFSKKATKTDEIFTINVTFTA